MRTPTFDLYDPFKIFGEFERNTVYHRADSIDDEGIKVELPGVKQSDVEITVEGRTLKIVGKTRHGSAFNYCYTLKSNVDDSLISAKLEDGLLSVSLPKKQESLPRKIQVT